MGQGSGETHGDHFANEDAETQRSSVTLLRYSRVGDGNEDLPSLSTVLSGPPLPDVPVLLHPGLLCSCQEQVCPIQRGGLAGYKELCSHTPVRLGVCFLLPCAKVQGTQGKGKRMLPSAQAWARFCDLTYHSWQPSEVGIANEELRLRGSAEEWQVEA